MRFIPTGSSQKIAIIAATKAELSKLKRLQILAAFNENITTQPQKSVKYQCFIVVYEFETVSKARLFRLAYALAKRNGKITSLKAPKTMSHSRNLYNKRRRQATARKRRALRQCKRVKRRYIKLIPLLKAGNIETIEAKAREIARINVIADLL